MCSLLRVASDVFGRRRHRPEFPGDGFGRAAVRGPVIWPLPDRRGRYVAAVAEGPFAAIAPGVQAELRGFGVVRHLRRGAFLILEGDRSDHVLFVRSGRLKIVRTSDDGRDVLVAVRGPGELVGELNALAGSHEPRAASVVALDDVVVQSIPAAEFLRFVERNPTVSFGLLRQLAARLREATARQTEAAGYDVLHRVARTLADEAERHGREVEGGTAVSDGLSQTDLAGLVAASTKSVGRALSVLKARGLVETGRRSILVRDLDGLRRFGG
jgi:CRP/FNR family transcriptional regulator, cyclic AMP receptor protein